MGIQDEIDSVKAKLYEIDEWLTRHRECPDSWPMSKFINARREQEKMKENLVKSLEVLIRRQTS